MSTPIAHLRAVAATVADVFKERLSIVHVSIATAVAWLLATQSSVDDLASPQAVWELSAARLAHFRTTFLDTIDGAFRTNYSSCPVCADDDVAVHTLPCGHGMCASCWLHYLRTVATDPRPPTCFIPHCNQPCGLNLCVRVGSPFTPERFEQYVLQQHAVPCRTAGCARVFIGATNVTTTLRCDGCQKAYCRHCPRFDHAPASCDDTERAETERNAVNAIAAERAAVARRAEMAALEAAAARARVAVNTVDDGTKACPGCGAGISKNGGCNHMRCRSCARQFCWLCGTEWSTSHRCGVGATLPFLDPSALGGFNTERRDIPAQPAFVATHPAGRVQSPPPPPISNEVALATIMSLTQLSDDVEHVSQNANELQRGVAAKCIEAVRLIRSVHTAHYQHNLSELDPFVQDHCDMARDFILMLKRDVLEAPAPNCPGPAFSPMEPLQKMMDNIRLDCGTML